MIDLERSLAELAEQLEIPNGDFLVGDVMKRIGEPARRPAIGRVPRLAGALVAALVAVVVVLPGPRHAVARWLGFDSVRIEPGVTVPTTASPTTSGPATSGPATSGPSTTAVVPEANPVLDLDPAVSIATAMSATGLPDPTPTLLGDPQSIHVAHPPDSGQIVEVFAPSDLVPQSGVTGVGALVTVFPARIDEGFFRKTLGNTATVRPVDVDGAVGYWIEGSPHQLMFESGNDVLEDTLRLATNTLIWQRGSYVYRIEADIDLGTALRIAKTVP
jgi:hypothetical protein